MDDEIPSFAPRLGQMETQWSLVRRAHGSAPTAAREALSVLVMRYSPAIRTYVKMLTRNDADTDELAQDVVVRLLKGDFASADPLRGRFRDLLMVSVRNMVKNHWEKDNRRPKTGVEAPEPANPGDEIDALLQAADESWVTSWRAMLIEIAMTRLEQFQRENPQSVAYTALRLRSSFPELDSTALGLKLSQMAGREINAVAYRQHLKRGRVRFAEYVIEEIAQGLESAEIDRIQEELIAVGLYEYVKDVLQEYWAAKL
jgi:RNA polymerase sigma factor (sigma-70 family)